MFRIWNKNQIQPARDYELPQIRDHNTVSAGEKLRQARNRLELTSRDVVSRGEEIAAKRGNPEFKIALGVLSSIENNATTPSLYNLYTLCAILRLDIAEVLEWYRVRWQIELVFKRLKSLAELGALPKHTDESARGWLYGKLLVVLLGQKLERLGRDISPWGYRLPDAWQWQRVAGL